jgi:hypothetical protein
MTETGASSPVRQVPAASADDPHLLPLAGLQDVFDADAAVDAELGANWDIVKEWSESSRYGRTPKGKAKQVYNNITDKQHGVRSWIKGHW